MNTPKKCGDMYIKYDENNNPEYGFLFSENQLVKFVPLTNKPIHSIILPQMVKNETFDMADIDEDTQSKSLAYLYKNILRTYITGSVQIKEDCFKGIKKARIIVPFENSIMLDWGCFDEDSNIELVLPKTLTLKQIYRTFDTGFDYEHENWTIIADKDIRGEFGWGGFQSENYTIADYHPEDLDYKVASFTISYLLKSPKNNCSSDHLEK